MNNNDEELISLLRRLHEKLHHVEDDKKDPSMINLPVQLSTDKAMALWKKAQDAGYVDANFQPLISRTQSAVFASEMAEKLKIRNNWKIFEGLWNRKNIRSDYYKALSQQQYYDFIDELKIIFS